MILGVLYELLWFVIAGIAAYLLVLPIKAIISIAFFQFLIGALFLAFTYFRFTAFMMHSIILESVWVKLLLLILNIPLFLYSLDQFFTFGKVYDEYNYTLPANIFQHIKSGTELDDLMYIKNLVTFAGFAALITIFLLELRLILAIFKLRQLDKYLWKKK